MKSLKKFLIVLIPVLLIYVFPNLASAQMKTITGEILDKNNNPISGASVLLSSDGRFLESTSTNRNGRFYIRFESGENEYCMLNISAMGFCAIISDVEIIEDSVYIEFNLTKRPLQMAFWRAHSSNSRF